MEPTAMIAACWLIAVQVYSVTGAPTVDANSCKVRNIPLQANFKIADFISKKWYTHAYNRLVPMPGSTAPPTDLQLKVDGTEGNYKIHNSGNYTFQQTTRCIYSHGNVIHENNIATLKLVYPSNVEFIYDILLFENDFAIVYSCTKEQNGFCDETHKYLWGISTSSSELKPAQNSKLNNFAKKVCVGSALNKVTHAKNPTCKVTI